MKHGLTIAAILILLAPASAQAQWKPVEHVEAYAVSGTTSIDLYRSIGTRGPKIGATRVIALTDFTLTWKRDYRPTADGGCRLAAAVPSLTVIYRLPRPAQRLDAATQQRWDAFIDGIRSHERVHGTMIVDMVRKLEAASVGLTVAGDPKCRKIRDALVAPFRRISDERVAQSQAYDREEMSDGGNVQNLVLRLVNGG